MWGGSKPPSISVPCSTFIVQFAGGGIIEEGGNEQAFQAVPPHTEIRGRVVISVKGYITAAGEIE